MNKGDTMDNKSILMDKLLYKKIGSVMKKYRRNYSYSITKGY